MNNIRLPAIMAGRTETTQVKNPTLAEDGVEYNNNIKNEQESRDWLEHMTSATTNEKW